MSSSGTLDHSSRKGAYTQDDDEEEIDIRNVLKLKPNVFRDERQSRIFCSSDLVSGVRRFGAAIFVSFAFGNRYVKVDASGARPRRTVRT